MSHEPTPQSTETGNLIGTRLKAIAGLLAIAAMAPLLGGCGGAMLIKDEAQFQSVAVQSTQPVLVMFFKGGCPSCALLDPTIDQLANEYKGRAVIARFMILTPLFEVTSQELKDRYDVGFVPHVVLLVNGQEKNHWISDYNIDDYRKALNAALGSGRPVTKPAGTAGSP